MNINVWWIGFSIGIVILLAIDLGIFNRKIHEIKIKEALLWSCFWIGLALSFNVFIYFEYGHHAGIQFLTAYFIEKSLSIDNLFVFVMIFSYFQVSPKYQHKVLFWGIIGALILRLIFIMAGVALINNFHWVIYVFGAALLYSGIKMFREKDNKINFEKNKIIWFVKKIIPVTDNFVKGKFFVFRKAKLYATPLLVTLFVIELADVIFAIDSIPAVLSISRDTFIIYSSNILAILGLRSLYFALSAIMKAFSHLHYGLSLILGFVGIKMIISDIYKIDALYSLAFIILIISISIIVSLNIKRKNSEPAINA